MHPEKLPKLGPGNNDPFAGPLVKFLQAGNKLLLLPPPLPHPDAGVLNVWTATQSVIIV